MASSSQKKKLFTLFSYLDLSVECILHKNDRFVLDEFFNVCKNAVDLNRDLSIKKLHETSSDLIASIEQEREKFKNFAIFENIDSRVVRVIKTLEACKRSFDAQERIDFDNDETFEHLIVLKILNDLAYSLIFNDFNFEKITKSILVSNSLKVTKIVPFSSICNLKIELPKWFLQSRLFVYENLFEIFENEYVLFVLKFRIMKFREYVAFNFGEKDKRWYCSELPEIDVLCISFTPLGITRENFFKRFDEKVDVLCNVICIHYCFEGVGKKRIYFDFKRGFENRLFSFVTPKNFATDNNAFVLNVDDHSIDFRHCGVNDSSASFQSNRDSVTKLNSESNLLSWIIGNNKNCLCVVLLFADFLRENFDKFEQCSQVILYNLTYFENQLTNEDFILLFCAFDGWLAKNFNINKILNFCFKKDYSWSDKLSIDNFIFKLTFKQLLKQQVLDREVFQETKLNLTSDKFLQWFNEYEKLSDFKVVILEYIMSPEESLIVKANLVSSLIFFKKTFLGDTIFSNEMLNVILQLAEHFLETKTAYSFLEYFLNNYLILNEFELSHNWQENKHLRDRVLISTVNLLLDDSLKFRFKPSKFCCNFLQFFINREYYFSQTLQKPTEANMKKFSNAVFDSYKDLADSGYVIFSLVDNFLQNCVVDAYMREIVLLPLVKQLIVENPGTFVGSEVRQVVINLVCRFDFTSRPWHFNAHYEHLFLECVYELREVLFVQELKFDAKFAKFKETMDSFFFKFNTFGMLLLCRIQFAIFKKLEKDYVDWATNSMLVDS